MTYYETDPAVLGWFDSALSHPTAHIRRSALTLLEHVDCARREEWFERAQLDPDPTVAALAVVVRTAAALRGAQRIDLYESDLATGVDADDLKWEWEYEMVVCDGFSIPRTQMLGWSKQEDDGLAREFALFKCYAGKEAEACNATVVIVSKRLVTRYTRGARSLNEAMLWHQQGRPGYAEP
ncbi:MAG: hypothetical protein CVT67_08990 [Actinobacteria bacterium HGW-Actinobacteria-7]|jgi:hypothetical protein|nr:MAG: hypothetical protein CVT67_08990 [Actinobacteria bacterium HGW-Actinobacteria-7]